VQSSGDVVQDLRSNAYGDRIVFSGNERYILEYTSSTSREEIEDIPLEYALAAKQYEHLDANDSIKAALIRVCQRWRIELRCRSDRADAIDPGVEHPVYPLSLLDRFVIGAIQHPGAEQVWSERPR
jgi:hypothetical protein